MSAGVARASLGGTVRSKQPMQMGSQPETWLEKNSGGIRFFLLDMQRVSTWETSRSEVENAISPIIDGGLVRERTRRPGHVSLSEVSFALINLTTLTNNWTYALFSASERYP